MWIIRRNGYEILDEVKVKAVLPRYIDVVRKKKYAKYLLAKTYPIHFKRTEPTEKLWEKHDSNLKSFESYQNEFDESNKKPKTINGSFLRLKALIAHRVIQKCSFCERNCGVDRLKGMKGYCKAGRNFSLHSAFPHMGEEPELIPSGTVFTGGCSIRCIHCQNWDISQWSSSGVSVTPELMSQQVKELAKKGCRNLNMVGGDPTPMTWQWIETMMHTKENIATIWNSNSYYSDETAKLLAGFIDLYLLDFKYGNNECAKAISDAPGYWEASTRNHLTAKKNGELIIRVLVLPGHNNCCTRPILKWIQEKLGEMTRVNLMFQYRPEWRARERDELRRKLTDEEIKDAKKIADEVGLINLVR